MESIKGLDIITHPNHHNAIPLISHYRYKHNSMGDIVHLKARTNLRGDLMFQNDHFVVDQTSTYMVEKTSIRLIYAISVQYNMSR